jgi:prevent-host-death family protein
MAKPKTGRKATEPKALDPNEVTVSDARIRLSELVLRAGYGAERFVIMRRGKQIAALIGARDLAVLDGAA